MATETSLPGLAEYSRLIALLQQLSDALRAGEELGMDEGDFRTEIEKLPALLASVSQDLTGRLKACKDINTIVKRKGKEHYLSSLSAPNSASQALETLESAAEATEASGAIVERLFKVTSTRSAVAKVKDTKNRRAVASALTKSTLAQEKVYQARSELQSILGSLQRRRLQSDLQARASVDQSLAAVGSANVGSVSVGPLPEADEVPADMDTDNTATQMMTRVLTSHPEVSSLDDDVQTQVIEAGEFTRARANMTSAPDKELLSLKTLPPETTSANVDTSVEGTVWEASDTVEAQDQVDTAEPASVVATTGTTGTSEPSDPASTADDRPVTSDSPSEEQAVGSEDDEWEAPPALARFQTDASARLPGASRPVCAALNRWAKWQPLLPARLGEKVRVKASRTTPVANLKLSFLWAERVRVPGHEPLRAPSDSRRAASLWSLPITAPERFESATQSVRLAGEEEESACPHCAGTGQSNVGGGRSDCKPCGGSGKMLMFQNCRTAFTPATLQVADRPSGLAESMELPRAGEVTEKEILTVTSGEFQPGELEGRLRKHLKKWLSESCLRRQVDGAIGWQDGGTDPKQAKKCLVRAEIEVRALSVVQVDFLVPSKSPTSDRVHKLWMSGHQILQVEPTPREWTWKASAWLAGVAAVAFPIGWWLAHVLR